MTFKIKPATRQNVPWIIGLSGGTGSGKTYSALMLASGLAGGSRFVVIDTEAGKAQQYVDYFEFNHIDFEAPFSPKRYQEAIETAENYPVIVIDSFSHEWAGEGGIMDMHDQIAEEKVKEAESKGWSAHPEKYNWPAWKEPKRDHKRMVAKMLQLRCHLILCLRAEPKTKAIKVTKKNRAGKDYEVNEVVDAGWLPICEKTLPFELGASFMLRAEDPGRITTGKVDPDNPVGYPMRLPEPLKKIFKGDFYLDRSHGEALAQWSSGDEKTKPKSADPRPLQQMILEDYVQSKVLTKKQVADALVAADLMKKGGKLNPDEDPAEVRAVLDAVA